MWLHSVRRRPVAALALVLEMVEAARVDYFEEGAVGVVFV